MFDSISHSLPKLNETGYSPNVIAQLKMSRSKTTNVAYDSKWKLFAGFAQTKSFDPLQTTPAQLAEFLTFLFVERKIKPSTIKGYRAAIGHVLRLANGYDPGDDQIITLLMKSFDRQLPPSKNTVPKWDIAVVLNQLAKTNNMSMPIALLMSKAIFLLALASGARRGEIWALTNNLKLVLTNPKIILVEYDKQFVFKTQFTRQDKKQPKHMTIPMLPFEQAQICPGSTLLTYLKRVKSSRGTQQKSLFIPIGEDKKDLSKQAISGNIVKTIRWAYQQNNTPFPQQVTAHSVRGITTTLRLTVGNSVQDIMDAGNWTNASTFFKFYNQVIDPKTIADLKSLPNVACASKILNTDLL